MLYIILPSVRSPNLTVYIHDANSYRPRGFVYLVWDKFVGKKLCRFPSFVVFLVFASVPQYEWTNVFCWARLHFAVFVQL
jgi:hypothetical protein